MKERFYVEYCSDNDVGYSLVCCGIWGLHGH